MTSTWGLTIAAVIAGLLLTFLMSSIPERIAEWRKRMWESDSDGNLPED